MIGYSQEVEEASIGYTGGASAYGSFDPKLDPIVESPAGAKPLNGSVNSGRSYSSGFFEQVPESSRYLVNNSNQSLPNTSRSSSSVSLEDNLANEFSKSLNISQTSNSSGVWNFKAIAPPPSFKLSRLLRFFNIPRNTDAVLFTDLCKTFGDIFSVHRANIETMGYAYIAYCDMRDAVKAFNGFPQLKLPGYGSIRVEYVQPAEFERLSMNCNFDALYLCGRSKVLVIAHNQTELDIYLPRKATEFGDVRDIQLVSGGNDSATYVCDFYDVRAAANFVAVYGNPSLPNQPFSASFVNVPNATSSANTSLYSATTTGSEPSSTKSRRKHSSRTTSSSDERLQDYDEDLTDEPLLTSSLTDPTTKVEDKLKHASLDSKTTALTTPKTYEDYKLEELGIVTKADVPKNNVIDLRRIAQGLDTRTTLMLRNIPNKVDQKMLQEYIDVTNKNTYDFLCEYSFPTKTRAIIKTNRPHRPTHRFCKQVQVSISQWF
ncbi:hypothetical protein TRICI_004551 [Trichomonascus ciferrii]|uniref:Mei2-like C-terminal RNA recognition motif domain-containing protein n=1 Tax=Trichomonascus ciferrii TaxID=44093 RepID=A0A642V0K5_9ASCO|nr:hypothetical protein TRICI_004551 [Trichomonascus ciferrii]